MPALATVTDPVTVANRLRPVLLKLNRHLRREIHSLGVTGGQASLLFTIQRRPGIGVRELATLERMSAPGMSKYVGRLEAAGVVPRGPSGGGPPGGGAPAPGGGGGGRPSLKKPPAPWGAPRPRGAFPAGVVMGW